MKLTPKMLTILRRTKGAINYSDLERHVPFPTLERLLAFLIDAHEKDIRRAAERKDPRQWTAQENEYVRTWFNNGFSAGELASSLERTPRTVEQQLNKLGLHNPAELRRQKLGEPMRSEKIELPPFPRQSPEQPKVVPEISDVEAIVEPQDTMPLPPMEATPVGRSCDAEFDEMEDSYYDSLNRQLAAEEEFQTD